VGAILCRARYRWNFPSSLFSSRVINSGNSQRNNTLLSSVCPARWMYAVNEIRVNPSEHRDHHNMISNENSKQMPDEHAALKKNKKG